MLLGSWEGGEGRGLTMGIGEGSGYGFIMFMAIVKSDYYWRKFLRSG